MSFSSNVTPETLMRSMDINKGPAMLHHAPAASAIK
jgi:hypothetical protein